MTWQLKAHDLVRVAHFADRLVIVKVFVESAVKGFHGQKLNMTVSPVDANE